MRQVLFSFGGALVPSVISLRLFLIIEVTLLVSNLPPFC